MHQRWIGVTLMAGLALWTGSSLSAQQNEMGPAQPSIISPEPPSTTNDQDDAPTIIVPPQSSKPSRTRTHTAAPALQSDPNLDADDQLAPSQVQQPMPAAVAQPSSGSSRKRAATAPAEAAAIPARTKPAAREARAVACSGAFGKNSSHLKLAMAFEPQNVTYGEVNAASATKVMASVLFANDPKRRLEVWWSKPQSRSETHLIVINGKSNWIAPGQLRLGLTLAELEKLNRKPFKLLGFDKDNVAALSDWDGGQLAAFPGGCKIAVSMRPDPKAPAAALSGLPAEQEFTSADAAMRAVNPTVSEILIGY